MGPDSDPRRRIRVTLRGTLQASEGAPVAVRVRNLSVRGAMLAHQDRMVPGQSCVLTVGVPGRDLPVQAKVIWSKASGGPSGPPPTEDVRFLSGLQFLPLPERIEIYLREYLVTLAKSPRLAVPE